MLSELWVRSRVQRVGHTGRVCLRFLLESAIVAGCYLLAICVWEGEFDPLLLLAQQDILLLFPVVILALQGSLVLQGLYARPGARQRVALLLSLLQAVGVSLLATAVLGYLLPEWRPPPLLMVLGGLFSAAALFLWRLLIGAFLWRVPDFCRLLIVGAGPAAREIAEHLAARPQLRVSVAGYVNDPSAGGDALPAAELLGPPSSVLEHYRRLQPDRVVVAMTDPRKGLPVRALLNLRASGAVVEDVSEFYENLFRRVCTRELQPLELICRRRIVLRPGGVAIQGIYTNIVALASILVLAPLMLLIAAAIRLTSRGPALLQVACVGFEGVPFSSLRFRTTTVESGDGATRLKTTRLGRCLTRWRLDGLPQVFNVLRGEMALVGPRPHRAEFAEVLSSFYPYYGHRHVVKPGLFGWAQLNLRGKQEAKDAWLELEYDLYYVKHFSLPLDFSILLHSLLGR